MAALNDYQIDTLIQTPLYARYYKELYDFLEAENGKDFPNVNQLESFDLYSDNVGDVVKGLILQRDVDEDIEESGWTPLMHAVSEGNHEIAALLLKYGASTQVQACFNKDSPLHIASEKHDTKMYLLLLHFGADETALNARNETPKDRWQPKYRLPFYAAVVIAATLGIYYWIRSVLIFWFSPFIFTIAVTNTCDKLIKEKPPSIPLGRQMMGAEVILDAPLGYENLNQDEDIFFKQLVNHIKNGRQGFLSMHDALAAEHFIEVKSDYDGISTPISYIIEGSMTLEV